MRRVDRCLLRPALRANEQTPAMPLLDCSQKLSSRKIRLCSIARFARTELWGRKSGAELCSFVRNLRSCQRPCETSLLRCEIRLCDAMLEVASVNLLMPCMRSFAGPSPTYRHDDVFRIPQGPMRGPLAQRQECLAGHVQRQPLAAAQAQGIEALAEAQVCIPFAGEVSASIDIPRGFCTRLHNSGSWSGSMAVAS